jgi:hypothetical protein
MATLRDDGFHVDVSDEAVERAISLLERLIGFRGITYDTGRTFIGDMHGKVAAFDLWGNLIIYHCFLEETK